VRKSTVKFKVACIHCPMQLVVAHIRQSEIAVLTEHLREEHLELRFNENCQLGAVLDHFRVTAIRQYPSP
jgi:hypothetical protein